MAAQRPYFTVSLKRSAAGARSTHRATLAGLGLSRLGQVVSLVDTPAVRGMLYKVNHLVRLGEKGPIRPSARARTRARRSALAGERAPS